MLLNRIKHRHRCLICLPEVLRDAFNRQIPHLENLLAHRNLPDIRLIPDLFGERSDCLGQHECPVGDKLGNGEIGMCDNIAVWPAKGSKLFLSCRPVSDLEICSTMIQCLLQSNNRD